MHAAGSRQCAPLTQTVDPSHCHYACGRGRRAGEGLSSVCLSALSVCVFVCVNWKGNGRWSNRAMEDNSKSTIAAAGPLGDQSQLNGHPQHDFSEVHRHMGNPNRHPNPTPRSPSLSHRDSLDQDETNPLLRSLSSIQQQGTLRVLAGYASNCIMRQCTACLSLFWLISCSLFVGKQAGHQFGECNCGCRHSRIGSFVTLLLLLLLF